MPLDFSFHLSEIISPFLRFVPLNSWKQCEVGKRVLKLQSQTKYKVTRRTLRLKSLKIFHLKLKLYDDFWLTPSVRTRNQTDLWFSDLFDMLPYYQFDFFLIYWHWYIWWLTDYFFFFLGKDQPQKAIKQDKLFLLPQKKAKVHERASVNKETMWRLSPGVPCGLRASEYSRLCIK